MSKKRIIIVIGVVALVLSSPILFQLIRDRGLLGGSTWQVKDEVIFLEQSTIDAGKYKTPSKYNTLGYYDLLRTLENIDDHIGISIYQGSAVDGPDTCELYDNETLQVLASGEVWGDIDAKSDYTFYVNEQLTESKARLLLDTYCSFLTLR